MPAINRTQIIVGTIGAAAVIIAAMIGILGKTKDNLTSDSAKTPPPISSSAVANGNNDMVVNGSNNSIDSVPHLDPAQRQKYEEELEDVKRAIAKYNASLAKAQIELPLVQFKLDQYKAEGNSAMVDAQTHIVQIQKDEIAQLKEWLDAPTKRQA